MRQLVLVGGQEGLLGQVYVAARRYKVEITPVQDLVHVLEYPYKAVYALDPEEGGWVVDRARAVLQGRAQGVAIGLRRAATRKQLSQSRREPVEKAVDCFESNPERLQYENALEHGPPIATGGIEGACRHLGQGSDGHLGQGSDGHLGQGSDGHLGSVLGA